MNIFVYELRNTTNIQIVSAKESNCGKVGSQSNLRYTTIMSQTKKLNNATNN